MNKEREIDGIKIFVSNETYNEYKGTLQDQINKLQNRINKAIEYIKEKAINNCWIDQYEANDLINILQCKEK